ncbi:phosphohydrolase [Burkholderia cepacia]|uniref:HD domain-containing protein n=1 Tax=Burkholderia cepacia TaxID=292 RepID=UPI000752CA3D|nr:HD domain-containing protein [Burkholderia cepacia]KWF91860.1 phosphohydrolase [Burkholderia cepacia]
MTIIDDTVSFTRMDQGTEEEYRFLEKKFEPLFSGLADTVLALLKQLKGDRIGYQIDRYEHSLQAATRAYRDGADEDTIVMTLLHDVGDTLAPENHCELAVAILRPYISDENLWILKHHAIFQGYYYYHHVGRNRNERDRYRDHPLFQRAVDWCEKWDQVSFDPDYDTLPLEFFEPMVRKIFSRNKFRYGD